MVCSIYTFSNFNIFVYVLLNTTVFYIQLSTWIVYMSDPVNRYTWQQLLRYLWAWVICHLATWSDWGQFGFWGVLLWLNSILSITLFVVGYGLSGVFKAPSEPYELVDSEDHVDSDEISSSDGEYPDL
jgi:hypothetical protein